MWYVVLAGLPAASSKPAFFEIPVSDPLTLLYACLAVGVLQALKWVGETRKKNVLRVIRDVALSMALLWVVAGGLHSAKALNMVTLVAAVFALGVSGKDLVEQVRKFIKEKAPSFVTGLGQLLFQTFFSPGKKDGE